MKKTSWLKIIFALIIILLLAVAFKINRSRPIANPSQDSTPTTTATIEATSSPTTTATIEATSSPTTTVPNASALQPPLSGALPRVTKKPFGLKVSPQNSPITPEKFSGYHTGVDFETWPSEAIIDVPVMAVCTGPLLLKKIATGYGGVAVQKCQLDKETVTVIYGHLRLSSLEPEVGTEIMAGQAFAVLGTGDSSETANERKHLHLGVHKGAALNILGYVQTATDLNNWLDATRYLQ